MENKIENAAFEIAGELAQIRHTIHKNPELGNREFETSAYIKRKLDEYGIPYKSMCGTGIKAVIHGGASSEKSAVLLRADMDALPIKEESGVDFASENSGCMHACGHDMHTACLIGAAKILNNIRDTLNGSVVLAFQPDEEGNGGAQRMIEEGILNNPAVTAAFALHVEPLEETGFLQIKNGSVMASPDDFAITITGVGGHGAYPGKCVNPIEIGAEILRRYKTEIKNDPQKHIVTICSFNGGTCRNSIPDTAVMTGTARSLDNITRRRIKRALSEIAEETALSMGGYAKFDFNELFPPVVNNESMNKIVERAAEKLSCVRGITVLNKASMAGDDFAYFSNAVPGAYFKLGVGNKEIDAVYPIHSPKFRADDAALPIGAAVLAQTAAEYLKND